ncbi:MAG: cation diffusion facilitator family transporter [Gammaproteobacteria bacterium]|nr:cation diffusion facilitator family transporter [Gammaproteobacteria bacterium]
MSNSTTETATVDQTALDRLQRSATYASVSVATVLVATKIGAWLATASVSVLSSLVDSMLDIAASLLTLLAVRLALRPADREHRFGHGKAEGLAALAQSVIITGSALYVLSEALQRLATPRDIDNPSVGIGVMVFSIVMTQALLLYQRHVVRHTGSMAIGADALHYQADLLMNVAVAVALPLAAWSEIKLIDPVVGILIAGYILKSTFKIGKEALDVLLDRELPDEERRKIRSLAMQHPEVRGFHDLRTRFGGNQYFIQFHLELDSGTSLLQAHRVLDAVEEDVRAAFPNCDIIVHPDPEGLDEDRDSFA